MGHTKQRQYMLMISHLNLVQLIKPIRQPSLLWNSIRRSSFCPSCLHILTQSKCSGKSSGDHKEWAQILGGASSDLLSPRLLGINCQLVSAASAGGAQSKPACVAKFIELFYWHKYILFAARQIYLPKETNPLQVVASGVIMFSITS